MNDEAVEGEAVLARVREYRLAARTIVEAEHVAFNQRAVGLIELREMAEREADPTVAHWSQIAIWHEARSFLGVKDDEPDLPPESFEARHRRLRLVEGRESCPMCYSHIATEDQLVRWSRLRRAEDDRRRVHTAAVE